MFDITFLIPDYPDYEDGSSYTIIEPDSEMPDSERERLNMELYELIDAGAFDPERETLI